MERYDFHGKVRILKIQTVPKLNHQFNDILIKIPTLYFTDLDKLILKSIPKCKVPRIVKNMLKIRKRTYYQALL